MSGGNPGKRKTQEKGKQLSKSKEEEKPTMELIVKPPFVLNLRISLQCLSESDFNPEGLAVVQAGHDAGFQITARNNRTDIAANLTVKSQDTEAIKFHDTKTLFHCTKALPPHMFMLDTIDEFLSTIHENDSDPTVIISHVPDSYEPQLCFKYHSEKINVGLMKVDKDGWGLGRLPSYINCCCKAEISSFALENAGHYANSVPDMAPIKMEVTTEQWIISAGENEWKSDDHCMKEILREGVVKYTAWFDLPHLETIRLATRMNQPPIVYFYTDEPDYDIIITFGDYLKFFQKADRLTSDKSCQGT